MTHLHSNLFRRTLSRNSDVYLLKIVTLAVAFATSILVILFSIHEFQFDTHYANADRLFRILARNTDKNYSGNRLSASIPPGVLQDINKKFKDRVVNSRVKTLNDVSAAATGKSFHSQRIYATDATITKVFSFQVLEGSVNAFTASNAFTAMLSHRTAVRYFGDQSAVGRTIQLTTYGDTLTVSIVAVFKDFPTNTHQDFDFFICYDASLIESLNFDPEQSGVYTRLQSGRNPMPSLAAFRNVQTEYVLQPIQEIYFGPRVIYEDARHGDMYSMVILLSIVSLIFLLALCSFVNLSTITLPYRAKEIAVKKLAGSTQRQLLFQFVFESLTLTSISLLLGVIILLGAGRYANVLLGIDLIDMVKNSTPMFFGAIVLILSCVVISPVIMVIGFISEAPTRLLSTDTITFPRFKRIITVVQFGVSIFLIVSSIVVNRQINYSLLKEPGRNHDQVVYIACPVNISDSAIHKMRAGWPNRNPSIMDVMAVSQLPGRLRSKKFGDDFFQLQVDPNFKDFFQFDMHDGRWFKPSDDDSATVVNQMAFKMHVDRNVVGVIQNLNGSFNRPEQPVRIRLAQNSSYNWLCIRVVEVDIRHTIKWIEQRMLEKGTTGRAYFLNPHFESWLTYQDRLNALSAILTLISALLAGCAIYGLTISLVRDKLKEIAVHQLFGARQGDLTRLLSLELLKQLLTAFLLFGPVTYIVMQELLRKFVYATKFSWLDPVYPLGYCLFVIIGLCAYQAFSLNRSDFAGALKGRRS